MEAQANNLKKFKNGGIKKKLPPFSGDVVFTARNGAIQTIPSLAKRLKTITDPILGLQFVWEYRSPSKSVPPHYMCRLCKVQRLQNEMVAHITGWKHNFRYMKKHHTDKVPQEEEECVKDPVARKAVKAAAAEVEQVKGRGQIKVVLKEPIEVPGLQTMKSAQPKQGGPVGMASIGGPGPRGPQTGGPFGGGFPDPRLLGEFPLAGGRMPEFSPGIRGILGDVPPRMGPSDLASFSPGRYTNSMSGPDRGISNPDAGLGMRRFPDDNPMRMGTEGFGMGQRSEGFGKSYTSDFPGNSSDRMMGGAEKGPESNSIPATLLKYLDTFRIENEDDAQIVLKVTQKLTDALMEYRLRSVSSVPTLRSLDPIPSMNYSSSRLSGSSDRFSSSMSGPSRYYN